jgi:hypothetical protein
VEDRVGTGLPECRGNRSGIGQVEVDGDSCGWRARRIAREDLVALLDAKARELSAQEAVGTRDEDPQMARPLVPLTPLKTKVFNENAYYNVSD